MRKWKNLFRLEKSEIAPQFSEQDKIMQKFDTFVGGEDLKFWLARLVVKRQPAVFIGGPATGKSLLLDQIAELPGGAMFDGGHTTKRGLNDFLLDKKPKYTCIDELDKMKKNDVDTLHILMENKKIRYQQANIQCDEPIDTIVYATCNNWGKFADSIKSRFEEVYFKDYNYAEYLAISRRLLPQLPETTLLFLVDAVWNSEKKDIRTIRRLGHVIDAKDDFNTVKRIVRIRGLYSKE